MRAQSRLFRRNAGLGQSRYRSRADGEALLVRAVGVLDGTFEAHLTTEPSGRFGARLAMAFVEHVVAWVSARMSVGIRGPMYLFDALPYTSALDITRGLILSFWSRQPVRSTWCL